MKLSVINIDGKKISDIDLSDKVFSLKPNKNIIATDIAENIIKKKVTAREVEKLAKKTKGKKNIVKKEDPNISFIIDVLTSSLVRLSADCI